MLSNILPKIYNPEHHQKSNNYFYLLIVLLLVLLLPLIIELIPAYQSLISTILFNGTLIVGVYICTNSRLELFIGLLLGFFAWLLLWLSYAKSTDNLYHMLSSLTMLLFFSYLCFELFKSLKKYSKLNAKIIYASICGFLLLGFIGGELIHLLELFRPNSFSQPTKGFFDFIYYSFVSLTTMGYGDIVPLTPAAKSLSIFIGVTGQMYLAIIVAIMVGKYIKN